VERRIDRRLAPGGQAARYGIPHVDPDICVHQRIPFSDAAARRGPSQQKSPAGPQGFFEWTKAATGQATDSCALIHFSSQWML
jgi:hypothetical protein